MALVETLVDDFSATDTAKWDYDAGVTVTGGQLVVPCTSGFPAAATDVTYDLTGSSVFVELAGTPNVGNGSTAAFFTLETTDFANGVRFVWGNNILSARHKVTGASTDILTDTYSPTNHRWLRISEAGGTITFATSANGSSWATFTTWTYTIAITALKVILQAGFGGTEPTPGSATFDNVNNLPVVDPLRLPVQVIQVP